MKQNKWDEVKFFCTECGYQIEKPLINSYTGIRHGSGWSYTCPECMSPMEYEQNSITYKEDTNE